MPVQDLKAHKSTYPQLLGLAQAKEKPQHFITLQNQFYPNWNLILQR